jgi:hypothetical protein
MRKFIFYLALSMLLTVLAVYILLTAGISFAGGFQGTKCTFDNAKLNVLPLSSSFILKDQVASSTYIRAIYSDGNYVYIGEGSDIKAYSFDGDNLSLVGTQALANVVLDISGDGTYIYIAVLGNSLKAYTFNGSNFSNVGSYGISIAVAVDCYNSFIFITDEQGTPDKIEVLSFNGSSFITEYSLGSYFISTKRIKSVLYPYILEASEVQGTKVYLWNETTLSETDSKGDLAYSIYDVNSYIGDYVFVAEYGSSYAILGAYAFSEGDITLLTYSTHFSEDSNSRGQAVWYDGEYVYFCTQTELAIFTFNGSTLNYEFGITESTLGTFISRIFKEGDYIYVGSSEYLSVYMWE